MTTLGLSLTLNFCGDPPANGPQAVGGPKADFTVQCAERICAFTDGSLDSGGTIVTRNWDFGDGSRSTEVNPEHTYAESGVYPASLTVVDNSGATSTSSDSVVVRDTSFIFVGAGDIANCSSNSEGAATAAIITQYPAAAVIALGDNAYPDGTPTNYRRCYDPSWGRFKARTHPAPGNHDYHTNGAAGYFGYFGASAGPAGRGYYSYDPGGWHIISLNSEIGVDAGSAQAVWLEQDLAAHPAACTLAYWHRPLFTSGANHPPEIRMRPLFTILYDAGADIVLSGHNHQYERFAPQRADGTRDESRGIREFVAGTGGSGLYRFTTPQRNSQIRYKGFGVLKLTLRATNYAWEFLPIAGSSFTDEGTGDCH